MLRPSPVLPLVVSGLLLLACNDGGGGGDPPPGDGGSTDAGGSDATPTDSGGTDTGGADAGGSGPVDWDAVLAGRGDLVVFTADTSDLPNDNVTALAFDASGRLWIGANGVSRFDGVTFAHWDRDTSDLPSNGVTAIGHGPDGALWVDTGHPSAGGSLGRYDASDLTGEQYIGASSSSPYAGPWFTSDGSVWGPGRLRDGAFLNATDDTYPWGGGAPASDFIGVSEDRYVWSFDYDSSVFASVLYRFDATTDTLEEQNPDGMTSGATSGGVGGGMVYLGSGTSIWAYDGATWTRLEVTGTGPEGNLGPQAFVDDDGRATWIAGGLVGNNFVVQTDGVTVDVHDTGTKLSPANPVVVDDAGNVWFGTGDGLAVYTGI